MPQYRNDIRPRPGYFKLVELMETVQGEGIYTGVPSTFVRSGMCNLECPGCDTVWNEWTETPIMEVRNRILGHKAKHIVFTGGEPTLFQDMLAGLLSIIPDDYIVTVESNAAVPIRSAALMDRVDLFSFSPKVGSLGRDEHFSWDICYHNIRMLASKVQLKYVLDPTNAEDVNRVFRFQEEIDSWRFPLGASRGKRIMKDERIFFQPYDKGCTVNTANREVPGEPISIRNSMFDESAYSQDLSALTRLVLERSGSRFRVQPQLHKYLHFR